MSEHPTSFYLHNMAAAKGFALSGSFELTPRCCFNCKMCYVHLTEQEQKKRGKELTTDQWLTIGEAAAKQGMLFALLTGGEPTLRPDFMEIMNGLSRMGVMVSVNSNGYLLRGDLLKQIIADPPHRFNITLYGVDNETYESLCGIPAYDTVVQNVKALREAGIDVKLNLTITPENYGKLDELRQKAKELGAHIQTATYLFPPVRVTGKTDFQDRLDPITAGKLEAQRLRTDLSVANFQKLREHLACSENQDEECRYCRAGRSTFWLSWDGKLLPCGMLPVPAADVLTLGFDAAWGTVRDSVKQIQYPLGCQSCENRDVCHICLAKCYCETMGFEKKPEYPCRMTAALVRAMKEDFA